MHARIAVGSVIVLTFSTAAFAQPGDGLVQRGQRIASGGGPGGVAQACLTCHGPDGQGESGAGFPRLAGLDARYLAKQLQDYASGERQNEIMGPIATALDEADRVAAAAYYGSLDPAGLADVATRDPASVQRGAAIFAGGSAELGVQACVNCHGPDANGLPPAVPSLRGQPRDYTALQLQAWREGMRANDLHGTMTTVAIRLADIDVAALADYLAQLQP